MLQAMGAPERQLFAVIRKVSCPICGRDAERAEKLLKAAIHKAEAKN